MNVRVGALEKPLCPSIAADILGKRYECRKDYQLYTQIDINYAAGGNLKGLSAKEAWETIEDYTQCDKQWKNSSNTISDQTITNLKDYLVWNEVVRVKIPKCKSWLDAYHEPIGDLDMMEDNIDNLSPQKETQLEDLGLNTYNHDIPLSSKEVPIIDELVPQPQPLPNCPSLDASLGNERGPEPPIKPPRPDNFRMKEVDHLTIHTPPSPYVAFFHLKDTYCNYHPCIDDPKKHYGFKP
ncbi:hypothetical protein Tco_0591651, partial [Tanacetum coccineum]